MDMKCGQRKENFRTMGDVAQAIYGSFDSRNFSDITVLGVEHLCVEFMENSHLVAQYQQQQQQQNEERKPSQNEVTKELF
jgi:hypothetical protein